MHNEDAKRQRLRSMMLDAALERAEAKGPGYAAHYLELYARLRDDPPSPPDSNAKAYHQVVQEGLIAKLRLEAEIKRGTALVVALKDCRAHRGSSFLVADRVNSALAAYDASLAEEPQS